MLESKEMMNMPRMDVSPYKGAIFSCPVKTEELWWQKRGLSYTPTGYGKKIPTSKKVYFQGRWRRIYCCIFSNSGTLYIVHDGQDLIVDGIETEPINKYDCLLCGEKSPEPSCNDCDTFVRNLGS